MSLYSNLLRGISFNLFGILISRGLSVAVVVMLARILGPEEFGRYSFLLAIAMMMIPLADFGISGALQKYVSYFKENQIDVVIGCGFIIKLCSSFLIAALVLALDYFAGCF
jgi:O-antigen/teichoic acid export membrane protein